MTALSPTIYLGGDLMDFKIEDKPMASVLKVKLSRGEAINAQPSAMMLMMGSIKVETSVQGGLLKGLMRKALGGETLFVNKYIAESDAIVWFVPNFPGDIEYIPLNGEFYLMDGAYLAHHGEVDISVAWRGAKGFLAGGGGLVWLKVSGGGGVWINGFGGLKTLELKPGQKITVDNYHIAGIESTVKWNVRTFGKGIKNFLFGGEFLVMELTGPGKVYLQSRNIPGFASMIAGLIPHGD